LITLRGNAVSNSCQTSFLDMVQFSLIKKNEIKLKRQALTVQQLTFDRWLKYVSVT